MWVMGDYPLGHDPSPTGASLDVPQVLQETLNLSDGTSLKIARTPGMGDKAPGDEFLRGMKYILSIVGICFHI